MLSVSSRRRRVVALVAACALAIVTTSACGSPKTDTEGCAGVSNEQVSTISTKLDPGVGHLRNAMSFNRGTDGITFVTAELVAPGSAPHDKGSLLTWALPRGSDRFVSVDEHARSKSSWPRAAFDVRKEGAYQSRSCANLRRGKTPAQIRCEQTQNTGPPIPGVDCGAR
jgi:hypothetical protein